MGVVVSAVASGIVQNIQADLVKAQERQEGKEEKEIVKGRQQESRAGLYPRLKSRTIGCFSAIFVPLRPPAEEHPFTRVD